MVNESKRCSNDLKWSHMPSNRSKKPPLAFFKKSPKFSGNFTPKNSGTKQIGAPLLLEMVNLHHLFTSIAAGIMPAKDKILVSPHLLLHTKYFLST